MEHRTSKRCVAMAYHADGTPKRSVGVWYPDIGTYTQEMYDEDHNIVREPPKKKRKKRKK